MNNFNRILIKIKIIEKTNFKIQNKKQFYYIILIELVNNKWFIINLIIIFNKENNKFKINYLKKARFPLEILKQIK